MRGESYNMAGRMSRTDSFIDRGVNCSECKTELTHMEVDLYDGKCLFCSDKIKAYRFWLIFFKAFQDWRIYRRMCWIKKTFGDRSHFHYIAILGMCGVQNVGRLTKISEKQAFINEIKESVKETKNARRKTKAAHI